MNCTGFVFLKEENVNNAWSAMSISCQTAVISTHTRVILSYSCGPFDSRIHHGNRGTLFCELCVRSGYTEASVVVLGLWLGAGLDGQEFSGLPGVRRVDFRFPFRTVSSSLGLNVRGTKPSASATSTTHNGPGEKQKQNDN